MLPVECLAPAEEDGLVLQHTYTLLVRSQRFFGLPDHEEKVNYTHGLASHCKHPLQRVPDSQTTTAECCRSPADKHDHLNQAGSVACCSPGGSSSIGSHLHQPPNLILQIPLQDLANSKMGSCHTPHTPQVKRTPYLCLWGLRQEQERGNCQRSSPRPIFSGWKEGAG